MRSFMAKGKYLGDFEQLVILAVMRLGEGAYGMTVRREIEANSGRDVSLGYPSGPSTQRWIAWRRKAW